MKRLLREQRSYDDVLAALKKAIAHHDKQKIADLQASPYYDDAIAEIRDAMKLSASKNIDELFDMLGIY